MSISKKLRQQVYNKYEGLCGYTGKPLDDKWQVDHITPRIHYIWYQPSNVMECNHIDNLIPTIRIINHYKRGRELEDFRNYIKTLHKRIAKLPRTTVVQRTQKRKGYLMEVAEHFGITSSSPFDGMFYFERIKINIENDMEI